MPSVTATTVLDLLQKGAYDGLDGEVSIAIEQRQAERSSRLHTPAPLAGPTSTLSRGSPRIEV